MSKGMRMGGTPVMGIRDKRDHVGAHSLAWTQLGIAARGTFGSLIPPWCPSWVPLLSPPKALGTPSWVGGISPYGEVLVGVCLCKGAGSSGFGAGMGFGRLWVLPPPGAGGAGGRRANKTPVEQEQGG